MPTFSRHTLAVAALAAAIPFSAAHAKTIFGLTVAVADGDTMTVLDDRRQYKIRLAEIDAPDMQVPSKKS